MFNSDYAVRLKNTNSEEVFLKTDTFFTGKSVRISEVLRQKYEIADEETGELKESEGLYKDYEIGNYAMLAILGPFVKFRKYRVSLIIDNKSVIMLLENMASPALLGVFKTVYVNKELQRYFKELELLLVNTME